MDGVELLLGVLVGGDGALLAHGGGLLVSDVWEEERGVGFTLNEFFLDWLQRLSLHHVLVSVLLR